MKCQGSLTNCYSVKEFRACGNEATKKVTLYGRSLGGGELFTLMCPSCWEQTSTIWKEAKAVDLKEEELINKIRRRVEDRLRKSNTDEIVKVAQLLGVKTDSEFPRTERNNRVEIIFEISEPGALYDTDGTLEIPTFPENIWVNHPTKGRKNLKYIPAKESERNSIINRMRSLGHFVVALCLNGCVGIYADTL